MKKIIIIFLTLAAFVMPQGHIKTSQAQEFTDAQKSQLEEMMKSFLLENGEIILDVKSALEKAQSIAKEEDTIFIGGSTFVVAEIL